MKILAKYKQGLMGAVSVAVVACGMTWFNDAAATINDIFKSRHSDDVRQDTLIAKNKQLIHFRYQDNKSYTDAVADKKEEEMTKRLQMVFKPFAEDLRFLKEKAIIGDLELNKEREEIDIINPGMLYVDEITEYEEYDPYIDIGL